MKKYIVIIIMLALLIQSCAPSPIQTSQLVSPAVLARVVITQSNITFNCPAEQIKGLTINASNVNVVGHCQVKDAIGTGLQVSGNDVDVEWIDIDGVTIGSGDTDYSRFFGNNIKVHRGVWINLVCTAPSHCDGIQTWGDSGHKALTNALFENLFISIFTFYFDSAGKVWKSQGLMIESGSPATNVAHDITVRNSVILSYRGLNVGDPDDQGVTNNIRLLNNTICGVLPIPFNNSNHWSYGVFVTKGASVFADKNIFCDVEVWTNGSVSATNNMVFRSDGKSNSPSVSGSNVVANPLLDANYCPAPNSPAVALGWGARPLGCGSPIPTPTKTPLGSPTPIQTGITPSFTATPSLAPSSTLTFSPVAATVTPTNTKTATSSPTPSQTPSPTATPLPTSIMTCFEDGFVRLCYELK